jgi:PAS domain S-box-containing protein
MSRRREPGWTAEDRFRLLVESVTDYAIVMLDPRGRVDSWNRGAERLEGYRAEEILGRHFRVFYPPEVVASGHCERELETAAREGRVLDEGWRVRKDGSRFWALVALTAMRDGAGRLRGFAKVTRDLSERRSDQLRIAYGEQRFRALVEGVRDYAIFLLDPSGRVETWNAGAERIKGYRAAEIIGRHFSVFYPPEDVAAGKCDRELDAAVRDGRVEDEGWRVRKDGSRFWADVVITALRDLDGTLSGYAKVTRDLTERRRAEEERLRLAEAQAAVGLRDEFLAVASHELRTPVAALRMQVQGLLRRRDTLDGAVARLVARAGEATDRLASLVDVLLDVSRLTTGQLELRRSRVDLAAAVTAVAERLRPGAAHVGARLELQVRPRLVGVWDLVRVEQIVTNVLGNAVKFGAGGPVVVRVFARGGMAVLEVADEGPGIPSEVLSSVFERFVRAAPVARYGGLGLGLFITRELVEAHGGTIRAENRTPRGALLTVALPLAPGATPEAHAPGPGA